MKRTLIAALLTFCAYPASAQTVSIVAQDASTGANVRVADSVNSALRVSIVAGSASGSNAAASATAAAVPASADYQGINVGGTLRGATGLSLGSHFVQTIAIVDGSGNQVTSFGGSGGTASNFNSAMPSTGTAVGFSDGGSMQSARVFDADSGGGVSFVLGANLRRSASGGSVELLGQSTAANSLPVVLASDQNLLGVTVSNFAYVVDGTTFSAGATRATPQGYVRDDASLGVGGSCAVDGVCIQRGGPYGNQYVSFVDPATGLFPTFAVDVTHDNTALATGTQGMYAYRADLDSIALVTDGDAVRTLADGMGRALVGGRCPGGNIVDGQAAITDGSSTSVVAAGGANVINEIWEVNVGNSSASFVTVDIRDGTAGSILDTLSVPAGGAISRPLDVPYRSTANTAIAADPSSAVSTVTISLRGCTTR